MATSTTKTPEQSAQQKLLSRAAYTELVAINFQIQPKFLIDRVPKGMELDDFQDDTYVSLVCMVMRKIGVLGIPISRGFVELSLRFYVRHPSDPQNRKGTCFIKRYVSSPTAAWVLSSRFDTEYNKLKMSSKNNGFNEGGTPQVEYQWEAEEQWNKLRVRGRSRMKNTGPDTKVGFILDHPTQYISNSGKTMEYKVQRPKWSVWDAAQANFTCDVQRLFGKEFVHPLARRPASVFLTKGSDVSIFRPNEI
jgi:hypothetical protein